MGIYFSFFFQSLEYYHREFLFFFLLNENPFSRTGATKINPTLQIAITRYDAAYSFSSTSLV